MFNGDIYLTENYINLYLMNFRSGHLLNFTFLVKAAILIYI